VPYYSLFVAETGETRTGVVARNPEEAIAEFGRRLEKSLIFEDKQDIVAPYLLGERDEDESEAWVPKPDIPVFDDSD
jgi:hypothetical protein